VQLRLKTEFTSEEYVSRQAWRKASLERCPLHPAGSCGFARHGTYGRVKPAGTRIPRWYCPKGQQTFSLLPDCFASRLSGSLQDVEDVVNIVEEVGAVETAAHIARGPDVQLPGAIRWTRRRVKYVRNTLTVILGLMPELFAGCQPTLDSFRQTLGVVGVLPALREIAARHLASLPAPVGLAAPKPSRGVSRRQHQHETGAVKQQKPP
jgi:hypothetical protein